LESTVLSGYRQSKRIANERADETGIRTGHKREFRARARPGDEGAGRHAAEIARTDISILLVGESGTGKEVYARRIHLLSGMARHRKKNELCQPESAEPDGAYAGSPGRRPEPCNRNSVLDGVEELSPDCQRRLLAFLQDGEPAAEQFSQVRLISSASQNMEREVKQGVFGGSFFPDKRVVPEIAVVARA